MRRLTRFRQRLAMVNRCAVVAAACNTYDHRLRNLVVEAGAAAVNDVALPRSTVATWKRKGHLTVVSSGVFEEPDIALRARLVRFERRLVVMRSLLCLLLILVRVRGARLVDERLPDGEVFRGEAVELPERLRQAHRDAIRDRIEANRRLSCVSCEVVSRAKEVSSEPGGLARKDD